jgi:hypothetical protein
MHFAQALKTKRHWSVVLPIVTVHSLMLCRADAMIRSKTFVPSAIASWSKDDVQRLRLLAQAGASIDAISQALQRSASAIRNKAGLHGISLAASTPQAPAFVKKIASEPRCSSVL